MRQHFTPEIIEVLFEHRDEGGVLVNKCPDRRYSPRAHDFGLCGPQSLSGSAPETEPVAFTFPRRWSAARISL